MSSEMKKPEPEFKINGDWDIEEVDVAANWLGIQEELRRKKFKMRMRYGISIAATLIGVLLIWRLSIPDQIQTTSENPVVFAELSPELASLETKYISTIKEKEHEIEETGIDTSDFRFIYDELDLLNQLEKQYRSELQEHGIHDKIIETIIRCHERRIQLLDLLLKEKQKQNRHEKDIML